MKYEIIKGEKATRLTIRTDRLDSKLAPELKSQFISLISDSDSGALIIDLHTVAFADSSGLSALLLAYRLYRDGNRPLILINPTERVQKLIAISQLTDVFTIASDEEDAQSLLN